MPPEPDRWLLDLLPGAGALVLTFDSGSARWLTSRGLDVFAVVPTAADKATAEALHGNRGILWIADRLPSLDGLHRSGAAVDFILLDSAWNQVAPGERPRAFRKLATLLRPGGRLAAAFPSDGKARAEMEKLARDHGLFVERFGSERLVFRMPDDGTGALPLLRHIILNDAKSSTYKLALLRVLCRIADGAPGLADGIDEEFVAIPLGLVALYWVRLFKPLLAAGLPQMSRNVSDRGLGFVRDDGFRALADVSHLDLRVGASFAVERAGALHRAVRDAALLVEKMPATYITYAGGSPVFPVRRGTMPRLPAGPIRLDAAYLWSFGSMLVPRHLWLAFQRFDVWIEPALTAEWSRLILDYAAKQARPVARVVVDDAMKWSDPRRDVHLARQRALQLMETRKLHCVWTGRLLTEKSIEIDHCFPWSAWPCEDLWNLLPAHLAANRQKRDRMPSLDLLRASAGVIVDWWNDSYLAAKESPLPDRFLSEARATLPTLGATSITTGDVFSAVALQQTRLKHDQQVPVWEPAQVLPG